MPSLLYTGRTIKKLARTKKYGSQFKVAVRVIRKKYGKVVDSAYYYHRGKGNWVKYSLSRDRAHVSSKKRKRGAAYRHLGDIRRV